jgi:hypothetical protein
VIPVKGKKPRLLTSHPEGSYEWKEINKGEYYQLSIRTAEDFWSTSRFLVVEVR